MHKHLAINQNRNSSDHDGDDDADGIGARPVALCNLRKKVAMKIMAVEMHRLIVVEYTTIGHLRLVK